MLMFIFGVCIVTLFLILWATLIPASRYQKGWLFTVKLSEEQFQNDGVQKIVKQYRQNVLRYMILSGLLFIPLLFMHNFISLEFGYFIFIFLLVTFLCETPYIYAHMQLKKLKLKNQWHVADHCIQRPEDDELNWRFGVYYVNKNDSRWMVEKKLGMGMTLNYGLPYAKNYIIGTLIVLILVIFGSLAPLCLLEMSEPKIELVNKGEVNINYYHYSSSFYYTDIFNISIIDEIPNAYKINGISTSSMMRGYFKLKGIGKGMAYVNLNIPPYILIETAGGFFLLNKNDTDETLTLYHQILTNMNNEFVMSISVSGAKELNFTQATNGFDFNQVLKKAVEVEREEREFNPQYQIDITYHLRGQITIELSLTEEKAIFRYSQDPQTLYQFTDEDHLLIGALLIG